MEIAQLSGDSAGAMNFSSSDELGDEELRVARPGHILKRMLSTRSYLSPTSARADEDHGGDLGKGQCGVIFALPGTTTVIKLPNPNKIADLFQDAQIHEIVKQAFESVHIDINVPSFRGWVTPTTQPFWSSDHRINANPNYGLLTERIYSLHSPVREALVNILCPASVKARKADFLGEAENHDCLVRLYLGRRGVDRSKGDPNNIKLRNFPLYIDDMDRLGLVVDRYTTTMAQALAVMHWKAGIDANDVEFVLGRAPQTTTAKTPLLQHMNKDTAGELFNIDLDRRSIGIWLLDFNQCSKFSDDPAGLKKLADGSWWNDPYYPRPNSDHPNDMRLWKLFSQCYLSESALLTKSHKPQQFIKAVVEKGRLRTLGNLFC